MKRLILLLLLLSNIALAQSVLYSGTSTSHAGYAGYYHIGSGLVFHASDTVSHSVPAGTIRMVGNKLYMFNGTSWSHIGYTDTSSLSARINLRLSYSDTAAMLSPYQRSSGAMKYIDTAASLVGYLRKGDTASMLSHYQRAALAVKYTDTAAALAGYARKTALNDTAAALRSAIGTGSSCVDTTSLSNRINERVRYTDTASMLGAYQRSASAVKYTDTAIALAGYLRKGDTAVMLNPYLRSASAVKYSDTAAALAGYLRKGDTAAMLNSYQRSSTAVKYADTAGMLTPYARGSRLGDTATALRVILNTKVDSIRRQAGSTTVQMKINGTWVNAYTDTVGSGGGGGFTGTVATNYIAYVSATNTLSASPIYRISSSAVGINTTVTYAGSELNVQRYMEFSTAGGADFTQFGQETGYFFIQVYNGGRLCLMPLGNAVVVGSNASASSNASIDMKANNRYVYPNRGTSSQRDSGSPAAGATYYCTDCAASDASTGVLQVYNGSSWKNCW